MRVLLALTVLLMSCLSSQAQELPEPGMMLVRGGVICDTQDEVRELLTAISLNNNQMPDEAPDGCGRLRRPAPAMATPLEWYVLPQGNVLIASLRFPNGWTQFSWIAFVANPEYVPKPEGTSL